MPPNHNRYSRMPEPEWRGGRTKLLLGYGEPSIFPVARHLTAGAVSSKTRVSPLRLQRRAFRDDALFNETPQGDCQFAGEGNDANLPAAHPGAAEPVLPPQGQLAVWLVAEPKPCQFNERLPRQLGARFAYPSIAARFPARIRTRCEADKRGNVPAGFEFAMVNFGNQHGCCRFSDRTKRRQTMNLFSMWKIPGIASECRLPIRFDFLDLVANKLVVLKHAFDITAKKRRKITPVPRFDMVEPLLQTLSDPLTARMDAVKREEPLDPADDTGPLLNQVLAFSFDPLCIFFFNSRNLHVARHFSIA